MFSLSFVQVPSSGREYGSVWLKIDGQPQNVTDTLISEGMVEVRQTGRTSELVYVPSILCYCVSGVY